MIAKQLSYGPAPESDAAARKWLAANGHKFGHFINGVWVSAEKTEYFPSINPANGETLAEIAQGSAEDVNAAVKAAHTAFHKTWGLLSGYERAQYLYAISRALKKHERLFAVLESLDGGKPFRETRDIDIPLAIRHFQYHAGWAMKVESDFPDHVPGGVVAQIVPWNFPLLMLSWKIAPALCVGNTIVLKPAEFTSLTALLFCQILAEEVKLPPGVINIVTGDGRTGAALVEHPTPWKIAFTGSTEVGRKIRQATSGTGKHLTLELGGKSPYIVCEDADLDSAVEGVVDAILGFNQGHTCCAGSRLIVQESVEKTFISRLKERVAKLRLGDPLDKCTDIGAINNEAQWLKILNLLEKGREEGGVMWQPEGMLCPEKGFWCPPTIFTRVRPAHSIVQEEIFGPVLACMSFRTLDEAADMANNTPYGLAGTVWSSNISTALDLARRIKAGTIWLNSTNMFDAAAGFGGVKESGYGREGGREGILSVLVEKPQKKYQVFADQKPVEQKAKNNKRVALEPVAPAPLFDRTYRFLINGKLARPDGAASFQIKDGTDAVLGVMGDANRKDIRDAVEAAYTAAKPWSQATAYNRSQILQFFAENLAVHQDRLARQIGAQTGRALDMCFREVEKALHWLFFFGGLTDKFEGTTQSVPGRMLVVANKEPVGVIGVRAPDELPLLGLIATLAPALAMGNTVVLIAGKYALTAGELIQVVQNSDIPAGVLNILTASDPDARARELAEHKGVDSIWFFGGAERCADIERASTTNMKRTWTPELDYFLVPQPPKTALFEATYVKNIWVPYGI